MPRYRLLVAYEGTLFHGWQKQLSAEKEPLRTAQGVLEKTVREVVREPITLIGASRTDAGVHAVGQTAAFTSTAEIPPDKLARALTSRLPKDIQVHHAEIVPQSFDPISDAKSKCYTYDIVFGRPPSCWPPLFDRRTILWVHHELDIALMNDAANILQGEHDFLAFTQKSHGRDSTVRTIYECAVTATGDHRLQLVVIGNGFLYNMVRIIAGSMRDVGRGHIKPEQLGEALRMGDRRLAGPTLPPHGLCLRWIHYGSTNLPLET